MYIEGDKDQKISYEFDDLFEMFRYSKYWKPNLKDNKLEKAFFNYLTSRQSWKSYIDKENEKKIQNCFKIRKGFIF